MHVGPFGRLGLGQRVVQVGRPFFSPMEVVSHRRNRGYHISKMAARNFGRALRGLPRTCCTFLTEPLMLSLHVLGTTAARPARCVTTPQHCLYRYKCCS